MNWYPGVNWSTTTTHTGICTLLMFSTQKLVFIVLLMLYFNEFVFLLCKIIKKINMKVLVGVFIVHFVLL